MLKLIVGLGNPGSEYAHTRHNAGAWFVDALAHQHHLHFKLDKKFHLALSEYTLADQRYIIAKPMTYMNDSGLAVAGFAQFFQISPPEILIVHDELDLPPGVARLKKGGGHAGHNGLRDIIARLGSADFYRLRIGIGHPGDRDKVIGFVLQNPVLNEKIEIDQAILQALQVMPEVLSGDIHKAMEQLN